MGKPAVYDFSGWASKYNLKCKDGRVILPGAFKEGDGVTVPLVYHHIHDDIGNVLGHAYIEHRAEGPYVYGVFNDTKNGQDAKIVVKNGDIRFLSIYANDLVEDQNKRVQHGVIREVSLVMSGANPGARIDNLAFAHGEGEEESLIHDEVIIYTGENLETVEMANKIVHAAPAQDDSEKTLGDVFATLNDEQKTMVFALVAQAMEGVPTGDTAEHSDKEDSNSMKYNVFEDDGSQGESAPVLTHDDFSAIVTSAKKNGSLKEAFIAHVDATYGINNIEYLFPDAQNITKTPAFIKRQTSWVAQVLNSTYHNPFSRIKSIVADITVETARARGYVKASLKKEEVFGLLKRVTLPTTIYKKQKLDRDDVVDITDFDVVSWLKVEMRWMLDEEIARAILVGDGRAVDSEDKIDETCIRPIWTDDDMYAHHVEILEAVTDPNAIIDAIAAARSEYKGSGNPTFFTTSATLSKMMLVRDELGHRMYDTQAALEAALRVSSIVEVPVMDGCVRTTGTGPTEKHLNLLGIVVNLTDYAVGADKGGAVSMFEDFDIDYNQQKYLIETRCSGALITPKAALVIEQVYTPAQ